MVKTFRNRLSCHILISAAKGGLIWHKFLVYPFPPLPFFLKTVVLFCLFAIISKQDEESS